MLEAFYFQKPEETSKALPIALNKLGYEKPKTMTTTGGISLLPVKLSEKINIIYNSQVENVSINSQSVTVETSDQKYKAEKVILATPAPIASKIFRQTTELEKIDRCSELPHRPRVLLGKMGLDGHDRGVKLIARALRDSGIHVIYSGLWQTPRSLAISARDEDADMIACSMMSNSHLVLVPRLLNELKKERTKARHFIYAFRYLLFSMSIKVAFCLQFFF